MSITIISCLYHLQSFTIIITNCHYHNNHRSPLLVTMIYIANRRHYLSLSLSSARTINRHHHRRELLSKPHQCEPTSSQLASTTTIATHHSHKSSHDFLINILLIYNIRFILNFIFMDF